MGRKPIPAGDHGTIFIAEIAPQRFRARCRVRKLNGRVGWMERTGPSKTAARNTLRAALADNRPSTVSDLGQAHAKVSDALRMYRQALDQRLADGRIKDTTVARYRTCLPRLDAALGALRIRELTTGRLYLFFDQLARDGLSADSRRIHRAVLSGVLKMLAKHDIISPGLLLGLDQITGPRKAPRALTLAERRHLLDYLDHDPRMRQRGMPDFVRFMLGTGCRIGEALAVRWQDVDLTGVPIPVGGGAVELVPVVAVTGNIVEVTGAGVVRHPGKTKSALRIIPLPVFVTEMLRTRKPADAEPHHPVFPAQLRTGQIGYKRPNLVQSWMREMRNEVGMPWLTSHHFRKTSATLLHDAGLPDRAIAGMTGHADLTTLLNVYVGRGELNPQIAAVLDAAHRELES